MNFFELDVSYFRSNESFFVGLFHGTLFSLPFSISSLVLKNRFEQFKSFRFSLLFGSFGFLLSYLVFFSFMCYCPRPLLQFWMNSEPGFMLLGFFLLAKGNSSRRFSLESGSLQSNSLGGSSTGESSQMRLVIPVLQLLLIQAIFLFLNPVFPAMLSKILVSQDILEHAVSTYFIGFFCTGFCFFLAHTLFGSQFLQTFLRFWVILRNNLQLGGEFLYTRLSGQRSSIGSGLDKTNVQTKEPLLDLGTSHVAAQISSFCLMGLFIHGTLQYSWRIFIQYPLEFFSPQSVLTVPRLNTQTNEHRSSNISADLSTNDDSRNLPSSLVLPQMESVQNSSFLIREFPSFDSCIRHREKNLPVERHLPIERMNARRTLSGRSPLNEEQKSDAAVKYNAFFLNALERMWLDFQLTSREVCEPFLRSEAFMSLITRSALLIRDSDLPQSKSPDIPREGSTLENRAKGKAKFSYIRTGSAKQDQVSSYIHDDISVLKVVLG